MIFARMKRLPRKVSEEKETPFAFITIVNAPIVPKRIPESFCQVMLSPIRLAAKIITNIGLVVCNIDASTGWLRRKPSKNINWLITTPNRLHIAILSNSFFAILSLGYNNPIIQKSPVAAPTLKKRICEGVNHKGINPFAIQ